MQVVVDLLADNVTLLGGLLVCHALSGRVLVLIAVGSSLCLHIVSPGIVVHFAVFCGGLLVVVLCVFHLAVFQRLHSGVVVVLMPFLVDDLLFLGLVLLGDSVVLDGGGHVLLDRGVLVAGLVEELSDGACCCVHDEWWCMEEI